MTLAEVFKVFLSIIVAVLPVVLCVLLVLLEDGMTESNYQRKLNRAFDTKNLAKCYKLVFTEIEDVNKYRTHIDEYMILLNSCVYDTLKTLVDMVFLLEKEEYALRLLRSLYSVVYMNYSKKYNRVDTSEDLEFLTELKSKMDTLVTHLGLEDDFFAKCKEEDEKWDTLVTHLGL